MILDIRFGPLADPAALAGSLDARAGVVEHGLFINIVHDLIVAGAIGVRHVRRGFNSASTG
jgi:ribose 5-phosphate isomerase A